MQHALVGNTALDLVALPEGRLASEQVERLAPKSMRSPCVQGREGSTDGLCLLDFGSRLGRWHKKCLQTAVLGLWRDSAKKDLKMRLLRMCSNNRGSGLAGGVLEASNFRNVGKVLRCSGKRVCVVDVECTADFLSAAAWACGPWALPVGHSLAH